MDKVCESHAHMLQRGFKNMYGPKSLPKNIHLDGRKRYLILERKMEQVWKRDVYAIEAPILQKTSPLWGAYFPITSII